MAKLLIAALMLFLLSLAARADQSGSMFSLDVRREAQEALNYFGFDAGPADGVFGERTRSAIMAYQALIGEQRTGEFSRNSMADLLTRYRADRRSESQRRSQSGLPLPVAAEIAEMAQSCPTTSAQLIAREGFLQISDLNNDGILDYLLDGSATGCSDHCGAANCMVSLLVSNSTGYRQNRFLGAMITPEMFNCLSNGFCEFSRR